MLTGKTQIVDRELVNTRVLLGPPELIWEVWTNPEHLAEWWGPRGFKTTTHSMDVRPGGSWRFTMHGPDGTDFENRVVYEDVEPGRLLRYKHDDNDSNLEPISFSVTVTFAPLGTPEDPRTLVTMRLVFERPEDLYRVESQYNACQGGIETFTRVGERLAAIREGRQQTSSADAPCVTPAHGHADDVEWQSYPHGQRVKLLTQSQGVAVVLSEVEPGCEGPLHVHPGAESIYVLEGSVVSNGVELHAGSAAVHDAGTTHAEFRSPQGARFIVVFTLP